LFHTGEGGAAFVNKTDLYDSVFQMHNFGHDGPYDYALAGINGKISELNAAMGHAVLDDFNLILNRRKEVCDLYNNHLKFSTYKRIKIRNNTDWNFSYYPIVFQDEKRLLKVVDVLNNNDIYPRRYFYPSINTIPFIKSNTVNPISEDISKRILCLPIYHTLTVESQLRTIELINHNLE
jgi:dTDP-4-amino-4,6-dideoxygalactose transaminase